MSETAEAQILAAAQHSLAEKSQQFGQLSSESRQRLVTEIQTCLPTAGGPLEALLAALPEGGDVLALIKPLSASELQQLYEVLGNCYTRLFPPAKPADQISRVQSLALVDFDQEEETPENEADDGFVLLEFDAGPETAAASPELLRQGLWLLLQLTAAWHYIHYGPKS